MKKIEILLVSAVALVCSGILHAGETRVWTSRKGTTLEGELLRADTLSATVVDKLGKQTIVKMEDLSIGDRQFIVQYSKVDRKILALGDVGEPEKEYRVDEKTFIKDKENKVTLGAANFDIMRTDHFLIATAGDIRPQVVGEAAERLWHGMAFQHMDFRKDWGDKRQLIILANDPKVHEAAGQWWFQFLKDSDKEEEAGRAATSWPTPNLITGIALRPELAEKYGVVPDAAYFNVVDTTMFKKALSPGLIHSLANILMQKLTGGIQQIKETVGTSTTVKPNGSLLFYQGHAFYKEQTLTGQIATNIISTSGTDNLKNTTHESIKDNWAKALRPLVKKGTVTLSLDQAVTYTDETLTPEQLLVIFSLSYYMQSTNLRLCYFDEFVRRLSTAHKLPETVEIAKMFGFDSVEAFNADWTAFVKEGNFK